MGAILAAPKKTGRRASPADRIMFSQKIVDFVVQDRVDGWIIALVEVDDSTHNAVRDSNRDAMTSGAGYRTIRIPKSARPIVADIAPHVEVLRSRQQPTKQC